MMQKVTFVPRHVAAGLRPARSSVLISIHDRSELPLDVRPGWLDVLYLRFHDTDGQSPDLEVFTPEQAARCLAFIQRHRDCDELVVHCKLGQSRSGAVALFVSEWLGLPCFQQNVPVNALAYGLHNRKVYATLYEQAYGPRGEAFAEVPPPDDKG